MGAANAVQHASLGKEIVRGINELAAISEDGDKLTRIYLTNELRRPLTSSWAGCAKPA